MARIKHGECELCARTTSLTFHHLVPKKMHRRTYYRKHFSKEVLNAGINVCRRCHVGIHRLYDESTLAKQYNSLERLKADEAVARHCAWVAKQKAP